MNRIQEITEREHDREIGETDSFKNINWMQQDGAVDYASIEHHFGGNHGIDDETTYYVDGAKVIGGTLFRIVRSDFVDGKWIFAVAIPDYIARHELKDYMAIITDALAGRPEYNDEPI